MVTTSLTHWCWNKMAAISQTTFQSAFSWMKAFWISHKISLKYVPWGLIDHMAALVQIMAWQMFGPQICARLSAETLLTITLEMPSSQFSGCQWSHKSFYWQEDIIRNGQWDSMKHWSNLNVKCQKFISSCRVSEYWSLMAFHRHFGPYKLCNHGTRGIGGQHWPQVLVVYNWFIYLKSS